MGYTTHTHDSIHDPHGTHTRQYTRPPWASLQERPPRARKSSRSGAQCATPSRPEVPTAWVLTSAVSLAARRARLPALTTHRLTLARALREVRRRSSSTF